MRLRHKGAFQHANRHNANTAMFTIVAILVIQLVRMLTLYTKYGMRLTGMLFSFRTNEILWKY